MGSATHSRLIWIQQFCPVGTDPWSTVEWSKRDCTINDSKGGVVFQQLGVEAPMDWSDTAVNIAASKYFRGHIGEDGRENSVRQMIYRVANTIAIWGMEDGYFATHADSQAFYCDMVWLLLHQCFAFNSPVWFNLGVDENPQVSACFINSVEDTMDSIMDLAKTEAMLFKGGSGAGVNLSKIRGSGEHLSKGGTASGPVSFMKGYDSFAGVLKSGGRVRRAAKIIILDADHPDIEEFISCKMVEEQKAHALIAAGYDGAFNAKGGAYDSIFFQNANHSVRVSDGFMARAADGTSWPLVNRTDDKVTLWTNAGYLLEKMAEAAWFCGDPGLQFDTTINEWHTCPESGRIEASNPCQPSWATVLTPEGIKTFADINVGSVIWSGKQWTTVTKKVHTGVKPVKRYQTTAGYFDGTENHKLISGGRRVEAKDALSVDTAQGSFSPLKMNYSLPTVMDGWVIGDGSVHAASGNLVYLCVGQDDGDIHGELSRYMSCERPGLSSHAWEVNTSIQHYELPKTYERRVPTRFKQGNSCVMRSFLRGLYSANGSICDGRVTLKARSFQIIRDVQEMLSALGIRSYYTTNKATEVKFSNGTYTCKQSYDLNITGDRSKFAELIGFVQAHKTERLNAAITIKSSRVKSTFDIVEVTELGEHPVWDITVEAEEHTYWTGGLLVSNCSEYMHINDSACNLASLNLMKFHARGIQGFDYTRFASACQLIIIAQDILIDRASYPTEKIGENARNFRQLGLGYANLGSLLMVNGLGYGSEGGREMAANITSAMHCAAYTMSAQLACVKAPFAGYEKNKGAMLQVINKHWLAALDAHQPARLQHMWELCYKKGVKHGFRNSQVTVLAPTGTIGMLMDCSTTGIEPNIALVSYKNLVGGGFIRLANDGVRAALMALGYVPDLADAIVRHVEEHGHVEGAGLDEAHLEVFDCALRSASGQRVLAPEAHILMMAAVQPFLSGAISKCVVGDTIIVTSNGMKRIGSLYTSENEDEFTPVDFSVPSYNGAQRASHFYYGGTRKVWRTELADGHLLSGTAVHRVRVATEDGLVWKRIPELEIGDFVAIHRGTEMWGMEGAELPTVTTSAPHGSQKAVNLPTHMTEQLALFLGMLTADGHVTKTTYTVGLTKNNIPVLNAFEKAATELFGITCKYTEDARNGVLGVHFSSKTIVEWLKGIEFSKEHVPSCVLSGSRKECVAYISGLFLDGWISKIGDIAIGQKHQSLLRDVQIMFDNLGIGTYFNDNVVSGVNYPVLHILGCDRKTAADTLQWLEEHKRERAKVQKATADTRRFPMHRTAMMEAVTKAKAWEYRGIFDPRTKYIRRDTAMKVAEAMNLSFNEDEWVFDYVQVVKCEEAEEAEVFDISVPTTETFVGNGIVNHNTCNVPNHYTVEDIKALYVQAWKLGLKSIAVYRDGCKMSQPLNTKKEAATEGDVVVEPKYTPASGPIVAVQVGAVRRRLPVERQSLTHKFDIGGHEGYITVGLHEDGTPGEIFLVMAKEGSTISGLMDAFATSISLGLQYGVPLATLVSKFSHTRFEPSGFTGSAELGFASSLIDYIFRWLDLRFGAGRANKGNGIYTVEPVGKPVEFLVDERPVRHADTQHASSDAPFCSSCGSMMIRSGSCYRCTNCGGTSGCS